MALDSVAKKVRAVHLMARRLGLQNLETWHGRAEAWDGPAQYAVSRATAPLAQLWTWTRRVLQPIAWEEGDWWPGLLALKGAHIDEEITGLRLADPTAHVHTFPLEYILADPFFREKAILQITPDDPPLRSAHAP